ncbi:hypothetical protein AB6A40_000759 [Gnathostoma spinigerum]|uniref:Uncharacterized protein n=1 Tax=Gnathostoma spinigerum TaxID=75299 RepID=A0ABD6E3Q3_9BILA
MITEQILLAIGISLYCSKAIFAEIVLSVACNGGWTSHQSQESKFPNEFSGVMKSDKDTNVLLINGYSGYSSAQLIFAKPEHDPDIPLFLNMWLLFGFLSISSRKNGIWEESSYVRNRFPYGNWMMKIKVVKGERQAYDFIFEENFIFRHFSGSSFRKGDFYHLKQYSKDVQGISWMNSANILRFSSPMPNGGLIMILGRVLLRSSLLSLHPDHFIVTLNGKLGEDIYRIAIYNDGQVEVTLHQEPVVRKYCTFFKIYLNSIMATPTVISMAIEKTQLGIHIYFNGELDCEFGGMSFHDDDIWSVRTSYFDELWGISANHC